MKVIICSLIFIILLLTVPPLPLSLRHNRAYSGEKLEPETYTSYDLLWTTGMPLPGDIIKTQRAITDLYLRTQEEASASIRIRVEQFPQLSFTAGNQQKSPYRV